MHNPVVMFSDFLGIEPVWVVVIRVPGVPDDELVVPRGDEEVVRQHDEVARREPRPGELQLRKRPHLIINGGDCNTIMIMRQLVGQESRAMSND